MGRTKKQDEVYAGQSVGRTRRNKGRCEQDNQDMMRCRQKNIWAEQEGQEVVLTEGGVGRTKRKGVGVGRRRCRQDKKGRKRCRKKGVKTEEGVGRTKTAGGGVSRRKCRQDKKERSRCRQKEVQVRQKGWEEV